MLAYPDIFQGTVPHGKKARKQEIKKARKKERKGKKIKKSNLNASA